MNINRRDTNITLIPATVFPLSYIAELSESILRYKNGNGILMCPKFLSYASLYP